MPINSKPRILFFDIESAGVNALKSDLGFVIIFGYKWSDEAKAHTLILSQTDLRNFDDRNLLIKVSKLMIEADILVGHFASVFDRRFIQGRLLINNLPPIPMTKMRDTCMIARSVANFSSNRLKHLAKILNMKHQKLENGWPNSWFQVMRGNLQALDDLADYCKGDVLALEELYNRLKVFDNPHPRLYSDRAKCGVCGGNLQHRGFSWVNQNRYRRTQCTKCGRWSRETTRVKEEIV